MYLLGYKHCGREASRRRCAPGRMSWSWAPGGGLVGERFELEARQRYSPPLCIPHSWGQKQLAGWLFASGVQGVRWAAGRCAARWCRHSDSACAGSRRSQQTPRCWCSRMPPSCCCPQQLQRTHVIDSELDSAALLRQARHAESIAECIIACRLLQVSTGPASSKHGRPE